jgi:hypothetical protein
MEPYPLEVFIFSFNRGRLLGHCLDSILRHLPKAKVTVVDDNSTDPQTLEVLDNLPDRVGLFQPGAGKGSKYGGLYHNLQQAYERAEGDFILFTQDDAQLVRPLEEDDLAYIRDYFATYPDAGFLNPVFPLSARRSGRRRVHFAEEFPTFFYSLDERFRDRSVTMYYTDICIASRERLRAANWSFQQCERTTASHARHHFRKMGAMIHPFLCQLPEVPFYRSGHQTWAMREIMRKQQGILCGFRDLSPEEVQALRDIPPGRVPYAEDWLHCTGREPKRPFRHKIADAHPFLKPIHKLELAIRKRRRRG